MKYVERSRTKERQPYAESPPYPSVQLQNFTRLRVSEYSGHLVYRLVFATLRFSLRSHLADTYTSRKLIFVARLIALWNQYPKSRSAGRSSITEHKIIEACSINKGSDSAPKSQVSLAWEKSDSWAAARLSYPQADNRSADA